MNRGTDAGLGETPKRKTKKVCLARMSEAWLVNMSVLFIQFYKTTHEDVTKAWELVLEYPSSLRENL